MRAIDANEFYRKYCDGYEGKVPDGEMDRMAHAIASAPTIDPESLRPQGTWKDKPTGKYGAWQSWCSVCGKHSGIGGIESNRHKAYCPNCGAKMKQQKGDADD